MSLPTLIIFERHWDKIPKYLVHELIPALVEQGYDTLAFEAPSDLSTQEITARHNADIEQSSEFLLQSKRLLAQVNITGKLSRTSFSKLTQILKLFVSSQKYVEVAEKIKNLPASLLLQKTFNRAREYSISLKGIDLEAASLDPILSKQLTDHRMSSIDAVEEHRINAFVRHLLQLKHEQKNVVFCCGALHAENLIAKLKKEGEDKNVLYYFPHSSKRYEENIDDIKEIHNNATLQGHTFLLSKQEIPSFKDKIIQELFSKCEIAGGTAITQFLSRHFKAHFKAVIRPNYHVDALLEAESSESIQQALNNQGIETDVKSLLGRKLLVIPNINTPSVVDRLQALKR